MTQKKIKAKFTPQQYNKLILQNVKNKNTIKQKGLFIVREIPLSCKGTIKTDRHYITYDYYIKSCSVIPTQEQLINNFSIKRF
jgi:hypothetical protein